MTQAHTTPEDANSHPGGPGRPRGPSQSGLCTFAQPHPTGEEMEAQRSKATCLGSHNAPKRLAARTSLCQSHQRSPSLRGSGVMILEDALNPGNLQSHGFPSGTGTRSISFPRRKDSQLPRDSRVITAWSALQRQGASQCLGSQQGPEVTAGCRGSWAPGGVGCG